MVIYLNNGVSCFDKQPFHSHAASGLAGHNPPGWSQQRDSTLNEAAISSRTTEYGRTT